MYNIIGQGIIVAHTAWYENLRTRHALYKNYIYFIDVCRESGEFQVNTHFCKLGCWYYCYTTACCTYLYYKNKKYTHSSCEIEGFVETHLLRAVCVGDALRSRVLLVMYPH